MFQTRESLLENQGVGGLSNHSAGSEATRPGPSQYSQGTNHTPDPAVFDKAGFLSRLDSDEELAREVVALFLEQSPGLMANLRRAAQEGDGNRLERAAHALKGTFAELSASEALELARLVEKSAREGRLDDATALLSSLDAAINRLTRELRSLGHPAK